MIEVFRNNAAGTLASGITSGATSLTLQAGNGAKFPSPGASEFFFATLEEGSTVEVVKVTARSSDTFTVTRAQQGSSGSAFGSGAKFEQRLTRSSVEGAIYGALHQRFASGEYYHSYSPGLSSANVSANTLRAAPFYVPVRTAFDRIACEVATFAASSVVRLGVYADGGDGKPGALLFEAGTVDSTSNGVKAITISQTLDPGVYWLAAQPEGATVGLRNFTALGAFLARNATFGTTTHNGYSVASAAGSLPSSFGAGSLTNATPVVALRAA
ncbi:MAG TPA: hypothetical protein VF746_13275 [Longimicrobium sp.]|jgi:hypothetical protein